jgi:2-isopropylmalate synthase
MLLYYLLCVLRVQGGLHVAAMERSSFSYQHVEPESVGNEKRVLISELSGRQNILGMMEQVIGSSQTSPQRANAILGRVKSLEARGYTFEGAEASVRLMILHASRGYCPPFQVLDYSANVYDYNMDSASRVVAAAEAEASTSAPAASSSTARATVKVRTMRSAADADGGDADAEDVDALPFVDRLEVADGNGPVDALANALLRALQPSHPYLKNVELVDYKVRILDPEAATQASTRVLIEFRDAETRTSWTTVSVDTNVISASLNALIDGFEYALIEHAESCMLCDDLFE